MNLEYVIVDPLEEVGVFSEEETRYMWKLSDLLR
jgi:hypothetical protein